MKTKTWLSMVAAVSLLLALLAACGNAKSDRDGTVAAAAGSGASGGSASASPSGSAAAGNSKATW